MCLCRCSFRNDGKLLVAGCENKEVQVFDMGSRAVLRSFEGHTRAVRSTQFTPDGLNILTVMHNHTSLLYSIDVGYISSTLYGISLMQTAYLSSTLFIVFH